MKRIALCLMLVFTMAFGCFFASADGAVFYSLWVEDVQVTSENADDVLGDGTVRYDTARNTLVLSGADIQSGGVRNGYINAGIYAYNTDLFVELYGTNSIRSADSDAATHSGACGIEVVGGSLTISEGESGSSLSIRTGEDAYMSAGIHLHPGIESDSFLYGNYTQNSGNVSIISGKAEASYGALVYGDINIFSGRFSAKADSAQISCGISAEKNYGRDNESADTDTGGNLCITSGASVVATSGFGAIATMGIHAGNAFDMNGGTLIARSDQTDKSAGDDYIQESCAIKSQGSVSIKNATVNAIAGDSDITAGLRSEKPVTIESTNISTYAYKGDESYGMYIDGGIAIRDSFLSTTASSADYSYGMRVTTIRDNSGVLSGGKVEVTDSVVSAASSDARLISAGLSATDAVTLRSGRISVRSGDVSGDGTNDVYLTSAGLVCDRQLDVYGGIISAVHGTAASEDKKDVHGIFAEKINLLGDFEILGANEEYTPSTGSFTQKDLLSPIIIKDFDVEMKTGDVNFDGKVNIRDATEIQKHLAQISVLDILGEKAADFDGDGKVTIRDATAIQRFIAGIE